MPIFAHVCNSQSMRIKPAIKDIDKASNIIHLLLKLPHKTLKELQMILERNAMKLNQTVKELSDVLLEVPHTMFLRL